MCVLRERRRLQLSHHLSLVAPVFSASSDATLKLWDTQSGQCTAILRTRKDYIKPLAYSPEREVAVSGGLENNIFLWDLNALATSHPPTTPSLVRGGEERGTVWEGGGVKFHYLPGCLDQL